jgi:hypothetical protein
MKAITAACAASLVFFFAGCTGDEVITPEQAPCVATLMRTWKLHALKVNGLPVALTSAQAMYTKTYTQLSTEFNKGSFTTAELGGSWQLISDCNTIAESFRLADGNMFRTEYQVLILTATQLTVAYVLNGSQNEETYLPN